MTTNLHRAPAEQGVFITAVDLIDLAKAAVVTVRNLYSLGEEKHELLADLSTDEWVMSQEVLAAVDFQSLDRLDFSGCYRHPNGPPEACVFGAEAALILEEAVHPPNRSSKRFAQLARGETVACDLVIQWFIKLLMERIGLERAEDSEGPPDGLYCWPQHDCADQLAARIRISWPGSNVDAPIRVTRTVQMHEFDQELRKDVEEVLEAVARSRRATRGRRRTLRLGARKILRLHRRRGTVHRLARIPTLDEDWAAIIESEGWPPNALERFGDLLRGSLTRPSRLIARNERKTPHFFRYAATLLAVVFGDLFDRFRRGSRDVPDQPAAAAVRAVP